MKEITRSQMEKLEHAEDYLLSVYWEMRDNEQDEKTLKKLDVILGKLYNFKCLTPKKNNKKDVTD